jgi:hypothetical protein
LAARPDGVCHRFGSRPSHARKDLVTAQSGPQPLRLVEIPRPNRHVSSEPDVDGAKVRSLGFELDEHLAFVSRQARKYVLVGEKGDRPNGLGIENRE